MPDTIEIRRECRYPHDVNNGNITEKLSANTIPLSDSTNLQESRNHLENGRSPKKKSNNKQLLRNQPRTGGGTSSSIDNINFRQENGRNDNFEKIVEQPPPNYANLPVVYRVLDECEGQVSINGQLSDIPPVYETVVISESTPNQFASYDNPAFAQNDSPNLI